MLDKVRNLYLTYQKMIAYLFFGGMTTVVNYIIYQIAGILLSDSGTTLPNLIAWIVSVLFAYLTNRKWVFHSQIQGFGPLMRELASFSGARILTLLLETLILWVAVDQMGLSNSITKLVANLVVILLNYIFSKFWVFKAKA